MAKSRKAFTIVEVVLVLAVFGLIIVMVFIAFPSLRNAQRRVQRQDDLSRITALTITYRAAHGNSSPFKDLDTAEDFTNKYIDESCTGAAKNGSTLKFSSCGQDFKDPDGSPYGFDLRGVTSGAVGDLVSVDGDLKKDAEEHLIIVYEGAACSGDEESVMVTGNRIDLALLYVDSASIISCYDNQ